MASGKEKGISSFFQKVAAAGCNAQPAAFRIQATIGTYDGNSKHHEILPTDGTPKLDVDLLKCKKTIIKEWRFVQLDELVETSLDELNNSTNI